MMQDILEASPDMEYVTSACIPLARIQLMLPSTLQRLEQHWATFTYSLISRDTKNCLLGVQRFAYHMALSSPQVGMRNSLYHHLSI